MKHNPSPTQQLSTFFDTLSEAKLELLPSIYTPDIKFRDPINQAHGLAQLERVLKDMFHQLKDIDIRVGDRQGDDYSGFLRWTMSYHFRRHARTIEGSTHVRFAEGGLVKEQTDFWDASFPIYGEFPLVGLTMRGLRKIVTVRHTDSHR